VNYLNQTNITLKETRRLNVVQMFVEDLIARNVKDVVTILDAFNYYKSMKDPSLQFLVEDYLNRFHNDPKIMFELFPDFEIQISVDEFDFNSPTPFKLPLATTSLIVSHPFNLSSLDTLNLDRLSISSLRIYHCFDLQTIDNLPKGLRFLDVYGCPNLKTLNITDPHLKYNVDSCPRLKFS